VLNPVYFMIDNLTFKTIAQDTKMLSILPAQVRNADEAANILKATEIADVSTKTILVAAFAVNAVMSISADEIWGTINAL